MTKAIAAVIAAGALIGVAGGLAAGDRWFYVGGVVIVIGVVALYAFAIWKNPVGAAKAEFDVEAQFSGYPRQDSARDIHANQSARTETVPSNSTSHADARGASRQTEDPSACRWP